MRPITRSVRRQCIVGPLFAGVLILAPPPLPAQANATRATAARELELSTSSTVAKAAFREALFESQNVAGAPRIRAAIAKAVAADSSFMLARVYQVFHGPGTGPVRASSISKMLSGLDSAPAPEMLYALAWRESAAGRTANYSAILHALTEMVPDDPDVAYSYVASQRAGKSLGERVAIERSYVQRFPRNVAGHNQLAYDLQSSGDSAGAVAEMQACISLAPDHPNGHDTFAEILASQGNFTEAIQHAQAVIKADSNWQSSGVGYMRLGIVQMMAGNVPQAVASFARRAEIAPTDANKLASLGWSAAAYAYAGDGPHALKMLADYTALAQTQNNAAQVAVGHGRAAAVEAYLGDKSKVAAHVAAYDAGAPSEARFNLKAITLAHAGDLVQARQTADQAKSMAAATSQFPHTLNALIALKGNDLATADRELAAAPNDLFSDAVRTELLTRKGQGSASDDMRKKVLAAPVNTSGSTTLDFLRVVARMHVQKLP